MTFKERFIGEKGIAPSTLPAPCFTNNVDQSTFKKTKEEKNQIKEIKLNHKKELVEAYGDNIGRHLNIPSRELVLA